MLFPGIARDVPEHFTHKLLLLVEIFRQLVGVQKEADFAHRFFEFFLVGGFSGRSLQIAGGEGFPFGEISVSLHVEGGGKDPVNGTDEVVNGAQRVESGGLEGPIYEDVAFEGDDGGLSGVFFVHSFGVFGR